MSTPACARRRTCHRPGQLRNATSSRHEPPPVSDLQRQTLLAGEFSKLAGRLGHQAERLLAQHRQTGLERPAGDLDVLRCRHGDQHAIEFRTVEHFLDRRVHRQALLAQLRRRGFERLGNGDDRHLCRIFQGPQVGTAHATATDQSRAGKVRSQATLLQEFAVRPLVGGGLREALGGRREDVLLDDKPTGVIDLAQRGQERVDVECAFTELREDLALPDRVGRQTLVDDLLEPRQVGGLDVDVVDPITHFFTYSTGSPPPTRKWPASMQSPMSDTSSILATSSGAST